MISHDLKLVTRRVAQKRTYLEPLLNLIPQLFDILNQQIQCRDPSRLIFLTGHCKGLPKRRQISVVQIGSRPFTDDFAFAEF